MGQTGQTGQMGRVRQSRGQNVRPFRVHHRSGRPFLGPHRVLQDQALRLGVRGV